MGNRTPFTNRKRGKSPLQNQDFKIIAICTVCPRGSDPFYIVGYYINWVTTSWCTMDLWIFLQTEKRKKQLQCLKSYIKNLSSLATVTLASCRSDLEHFLVRMYCTAGELYCTNVPPYPTAGLTIRSTDRRSVDYQNLRKLTGNKKYFFSPSFL